jgi:hypothetical protein
MSSSEENYHSEGSFEDDVGNDAHDSDIPAKAVRSDPSLNLHPLQQLTYNQAMNFKMTVSVQNMDQWSQPSRDFSILQRPLNLCHRHQFCI